MGESRDGEHSSCFAPSVVFFCNAYPMSATSTLPVQAIAWLSCFPKLLISYNISLRHMLIMSVWVLMAVGQWAYASALRKETRWVSGGLTAYGYCIPC